MPSHALDLDHVGIAVRDLDSGEHALRALGFQLTERSHHRGSPTPGAPVVEWGSANHCAMLQQGYIELVGLTDPAKFSSVKPMLEAYQGAHIVAFQPESVERVRACLSDQGVAVDSIRYLERTTSFGPRGDERRRVAFKNMYLTRSTFTEARFQYTEHLTREVMWQPHLLSHPNGAIGLAEVFLCSPHSSETAAKLSPATGVAAHPVAAGEIRMQFQNSALTVIGPDEWQHLAPQNVLPPLPAPVGFGVKVTSLARTRTLLRQNKVEFVERSGVWVSVCGTILRFAE